LKVDVAIKHGILLSGNCNLLIFWMKFGNINQGNINKGYISKKFFYFKLQV